MPSTPPFETLLAGIALSFEGKPTAKELVAACKENLRI